MSLKDSPLGKQTQYVSEYEPELLHPIPRALNRQPLGILGDELPFVGVDIWNGYELSWLNPKGKPQVAMAEFRIPCHSRNIIESKSFKLYLNSLNQTRFESRQQVQALLARDLSAKIGNAEAEVRLASVGEAFQGRCFDNAVCLDDLDVEIDCYRPAPELLALEGPQEVAETLVSHLLKSNCPVTGQPDWASLFIRYQGGKIDHTGLLRYIVSFREHQDFHEHCVERMFCDIMARCRPQQLMVYARYTRRGGLDINPLRSTHAVDADNPRLDRQ